MDIHGYNVGVRMRRTLILVGLLVTPQLACAQHAKRPVPLEIPDGEVLRCIRLDSNQAGSSRRTEMREFRVGDPRNETTPEGLLRSRKITVAADSLGRPLLIAEETSQDWLGAVFIVRVISDDTTKSIRQDIAIDSLTMARAIEASNIAGIDAATRKLPQRMMTATERDRADSLATWLWARRCGRAR